MVGGATGVACLSLGRGLIGIERDPRYFEMAVEAMAAAAAQPPLPFCDDSLPTQAPLGLEAGP